MKNLNYRRNELKGSKGLAVDYVLKVFNKSAKGIRRPTDKYQ